MKTHKTELTARDGGWRLHNTGKSANHGLFAVFQAEKAEIKRALNPNGLQSNNLIINA